MNVVRLPDINGDRHAGVFHGKALQHAFTDYGPVVGFDRQAGSCLEIRQLHPGKRKVAFTPALPPVLNQELKLDGI